MIKTKFVFAVSMVAMMAVNVANAEIAATSYVDKGVTTATNAANAAQTSANAANTAAGKAQTSANNAQVAADNAQASADAAAASAKTANDAVALKQDKSTAVTHTANTAAGSATVPVYVNANGVATAITSYSGTAAKATADASGNTITTTYEKVANKKGSTYTSGSETEYTSVLAAETIANKAVAASKAQLGALADLDTVSTEYIDDGTITNEDIATDAAIAISKISGLQTALNGKLSTTGTAAKATADASGNNIVNTYATKTALSDGLATKQATLNTSNIKGSGSVSVAIADGVITVSGTDNNTTYSTGNASTSGLTKLYTATGSNTDGTMTQSAITTALNGKLSTTGTAAKATADASGNTITTTYEKVANKKGSTYTSGSETEYTSVLAAETIANKAVAASKAQLGALADLDTVSTEYIDDGAVTAAKTTGIYGYIPSGTDKSGTAEIWVE